MRFLIGFVLPMLLWGCQKSPSQQEAPATQNDSVRVVRTKHANGKIKAEIPYRDKKKHGLSRSFDDQGHPLLELPYVNDKRHGQSKRYYAGGKRLYQTTEYQDDKMHGWQRRYREDGKIMSEARYENDFACTDLREYHTDHSLKTNYPKIVIKTIDQLETRGRYVVEVSVSQRVRKVKFYLGKLTATGCMSDQLEHIRLDETRQTGILVYDLVPGQFLMEEINIVAAVETPHGNTAILQKRYPLAINN